MGNLVRRAMLDICFFTFQIDTARVLDKTHPVQNMFLYVRRSHASNGKVGTVATCWIRVSA